MADLTPKRTGLPLLIDSDLANTLDFHVASTNFLNVVDEYANHIAASYVYNYQKHTVDPIFKEAIFFQKFNDSTLHLKDDTSGHPMPGQGGIDQKVQEAIASGAYMSILDTLLEPEEVWIRDESNWPESKSNAGNPYAPAGTVKSYHALNLLTGVDRWIPLTQDPQALVRRKISNLEDNWGAEDVQEEFLLHWYQKYQRSHDTVKKEYKKFVTSEQLNYFTELSDSIGLLARDPTEYADNTMLPIADTEFKTLDTIPCTVHPVAHDKLDLETRLLTGELSMKTNNLFRRNMSKMYRLFTTADLPHGEDVVTDYLHFGRCMGVQGALDVTVAEVIGRAHKLLGYIRNAANEQKVKSPTFTVAVENSLIKVDFLKDRINTITSSRTNTSVLKAEAITRDLS